MKNTLWVKSRHNAFALNNMADKYNSIDLFENSLGTEVEPLSYKYNCSNVHRIPIKYKNYHKYVNRNLYNNSYICRKKSLLDYKYM